MLSDALAPPSDWPCTNSSSLRSQHSGRLCITLNRAKHNMPVGMFHSIISDQWRRRSSQPERTMSQLVELAVVASVIVRRTDPLLLALALVLHRRCHCRSLWAILIAVNFVGLWYSISRTAGFERNDIWKLRRQEIVPAYSHKVERFGMFSHVKFMMGYKQCLNCRGWEGWTPSSLPNPIK